MKKATALNNDNETIESLYYPLYDKLLNLWFPASEDFDVAPQWTIPGSKKSVDFAVTFAIQFQEKPILLVEVKPPSAVAVESTRMEAIAQVLSLLDEVGPTNTSLDRLYAISALGKRWRACYATKGSTSQSGRSVAITGSSNTLRGHEVENWAPDIVSEESFNAMNEIVNTIKGYL